MKKKMFAILLWLSIIFMLTSCATSNEQYESTISPTATATETTTTSAPASVIPSNSKFEAHYIDVGQADSALIICDDETMLIDGGNVADSSLIAAFR